MSTPDRVAPSLMNCTARVDGLDGPCERSNLALIDPAPEGRTCKRGEETGQLLFKTLLLKFE